MPTMTSYDNGQFCWITLPAESLANAKAFYGTVFGWTFREDPLPEAPGAAYVQCLSGGRVVAGLGEMRTGDKEAGLRSAWASYVSVDDLDACTARAEELGASVLVGPGDVGSFGRLSMVTDPQGALFGLWEKGTHFGAELVDEPVSLCWNELHTTAIAGAETFYASLFGWAFSSSELSPVPYRIITCDGRPNGGVMALDDPIEQMPEWLAYISVADCDATASAIAGAGGTVLVEPTYMPGVGRAVLFADPGGATAYALEMEVPE